MGLAASQARLLTITSRLSSVELRQQRIAMDKMRLASDQQGVSDKYTKALSNKTLSFSDGKNTIPMSYTTLVSQGYSVARASDGLTPSRPSGETTANVDGNGSKVVSKPTCPRPEEYTKPQISSQSVLSEDKKIEAKDWDSKIQEFKKIYGEYPSTQSTTMNDLLKNIKLDSSSSATIGNAYRDNVTIDANGVTRQNVFGKDISSKSLYEIANPSGGEKDYVVLLAQDGDKVGGTPDAKAREKLGEIGEALIPKMAQALGITANSDSFINEMKKYVETLKAGINFSDRNRERDETTAYNKAVTEARNGLVGNLTETYKTGNDNDGYFLNLSEMVRRLIQKAVSIYSTTPTPETQVLNKKTTSYMANNVTFGVSSNGYGQTEWQAKAKEEFNKYNYSVMNWSEALIVAEFGYDKAVSDSELFYSNDTEYQAALSEYNKNVANAKAQWDAYDAYLNGTSSSGNTSATVVNSSEEFYNQLQNSQFLIQGLLSGYLTLMKDGKEVSLASATDILEDYDKSDDAAAEAEYNSQMNKINMKEKMLDMQAKRIDTEYSALTTEYESIKNIISQHTSNDFSYFT